MEVYRPHRANKEEMAQFHDQDYLDFLERISPYNAGAFMSELRKFNLADDCPTFSGLFDFCK
jgi:acetoin utilization deacetylase AcuC-like enzyme